MLFFICIINFIGFWKSNSLCSRFLRKDKRQINVEWMNEELSSHPKSQAFGGWLDCMLDFFFYLVKLNKKKILFASHGHGWILASYNGHNSFA